jgi:O-antigen ligase
MTQFFRIYYFVLVFAYCFLIKLSFAGFPLRALIAASLVVCLILYNFNYILDFLSRHFFTFMLFLSVAIIGVTLSISSDREMSVVIEEFFRNVGQEFLILFATLYVCRFTGANYVANVFVGATLISGMFALFQAVDLGFAWAIYDKIQALQGVPFSVRNNPDYIGRPPGLSLHPVTFSYQVVAAYVVANFMYFNGHIKQRSYFVISGLLFAMAMACETRSAVMGMAIHEAIMILRRPNKWSLIWLGAMAFAGVALLFVLASSDSRLAQTDDTSAVGRLVLYNFGIRLAIDHPLGFGWGTEPSDLAWLYWEHLSSFVNAEGIYRLGIHNCFINYFLTYGLLGVAAFLLCTVRRLRKLWAITLGSLAYLIHAFFHNDGPFFSEYYFFFFLGVFYYLYDTQTANEKELARRTARGTAAAPGLG